VVQVQTVVQVVVDKVKLLLKQVVVAQVDKVTQVVQEQMQAVEAEELLLLVLMLLHQLAVQVEQELHHL